VTEGLQINEEQNGNIRILRLQGSVDSRTSPSLDRELDALLLAQHKNVLLDFASVEDLSDEGLQVLVSKTKKFKAERGVLGVSNLNEDIVLAIRNKGLDKVLFLYRDEQGALKTMPRE
jgi:anti-anti-sigma factor